MFVLIEGNYPQVKRRLLPKNVANIQLQVSRKVDNALNVDFPRTTYLSEHISSANLDRRIRDELLAHPNCTYNQGDLDGGIVEEHWRYAPTYADLIEYWLSRGISSQSAIQSIRLCYVNDNNVVCSFSMMIVAEDPVNSQQHWKYRYCMAIYKNITDIQENRTITYLTDPRLLLNQTRGEKITALQLLTKLQTVLQSKVLLAAILPIILSGEYANIPAFERLRHIRRNGSNGSEERNIYADLRKLNRSQDLLAAVRCPQKDIALTQTQFKNFKTHYLQMAATVLIGLIGVASMIYAGIAIAPIFAIVGMTLSISGVFFGRKSYINFKIQSEQLLEYRERRDIAAFAQQEAMRSPSPPLIEPVNYPPPVPTNTPNEQTAPHQEEYFGATSLCNQF